MPDPEHTVLPPLVDVENPFPRLAVMSQRNEMPSLEQDKEIRAIAMMLSKLFAEAKTSQDGILNCKKRLVEIERQLVQLTELPPE